MVIGSFPWLSSPYTNINLKNPGARLRGSECVLLWRQPGRCAGLNPVNLLFDTAECSQERYDLEQVREHYPRSVSNRVYRSG